MMMMMKGSSFADSASPSKPKEKRARPRPEKRRKSTRLATKPKPVYNPQEYFALVKESVRLTEYHEKLQRRREQLLARRRQSQSSQYRRLMDRHERRRELEEMRSTLRSMQRVDASDQQQQQHDEEKVDGSEESLAEELDLTSTQDGRRKSSRLRKKQRVDYSQFYVRPAVTEKHEMPMSGMTLEEVEAEILRLEQVMMMMTAAGDHSGESTAGSSDNAKEEMHEAEEGESENVE